MFKTVFQQLFPALGNAFYLNSKFFRLSASLTLLGGHH